MVTKQQIDEIVRILVRECKPEKIVLFGSYAKGTPHQDSDLDLALVKETDLPKFKRPIEFQKALRAGGRRWFFSMDIVVYTPAEWEEWKKNPNSLVYEILTTGKTLYESPRPARLVY